MTIDEDNKNTYEELSHRCFCSLLRIIVKKGGRIMEEMDDVQKMCGGNYLETFDDVLNIHIQRKHEKNPILTVIKERYEEAIYQRDEFQKKVFEKRSDVRKRIEERFGKECKELIDQLCFYEKIEKDELMDKAFLYGFTIATKLEDEIQKNEIGIGQLKI